MKIRKFENFDLGRFSEDDNIFPNGQEEDAELWDGGNFDDEDFEDEDFEGDFDEDGSPIRRRFARKDVDPKRSFDDDDFYDDDYDEDDRWWGVEE
jgi:hypothetical protein